MKASVGRDIADFLTASWRSSPPVLQVSAEQLAIATPPMLSTGMAALVWRRIQPLDLPQSEFISNLRQGWRQHMLQAAVHEFVVKDVFKRLRSVGIEPLLMKGWALARLYPDAGLRPYGDIDLWFPEEQRDACYEALRSGDHTYCVDAHTRFYPPYERSWKDVFGRSQLVPLDGISVRVPCPEDHLRFICLHFLFHGGWRPLWLCDVAVMVESRAPNFDWDRCLAGKRKYTDWIACVIGLAAQLLGAELTGTPVEKRARNLPHWLVPAVLHQWSLGRGMSLAENLSFSLPRRLLDPSALGSALAQHWRNPIQASVEMNAWFNEGPRGPLQLAAAFLRLAGFARYLGRGIVRT